MFQKHFRLLALLAASPLAALAQTGGVGIGTTAPDVSAALDIVSSTKGALLPRVADATAIATPATGLLVFQTGGTAGFYYNAGTPAAPSWQRLVTGAGGTDFIRNGTTQQVGANYNIDGSGRVGSDLGVAGSLYADIANRNDGTFAGGSPLRGLVFGAPGSGEGIGSIRTGGAANPVGLDFYTSYVPRLSVTNAGQVGIGTGSPGQKLTVEGGIVATTGELIRVQGAHLQWNRSGSDGETWLLNQRGLGPGSIRFGATDAVSSGTNTVTEWARFDNSGKLGIGTPSPGSTLDVVGDATLRNGQGSFAFHNYGPTSSSTILLGSLTGAGNNGPQLRFTGGGSNGTNDFIDLGQDGSGNFTLEIQDAPRLTVLGVPAGAATGNVGIGTITPGQKLEVAGGIKFTGTGNALTFPDGTTQTTAGLTGGNAILNQTTPQAGSNFSIDGNGTIGGNSTVGGNLGVGTPNPQQKLMVAGGIAATASELVRTQGAYLQWNRSNSDGETWLLNQRGQGYGGIRFGTTDAVGSGTNTVTEWVRFDYNGNVGIGTPTPGQKLEVAGNTAVSGNTTIGGNGTIGGSLGVGTTATPQKLTVAGGIVATTSELIRTPGAHLQWNRSGTDGETWLLNQRGLGTGGIRFGTTDAVGSGTNTSTEWARFDSNGNLGLGTPTPGQKLEVAGGIKFTGTGNALTFPDGSTQTTAAKAPNLTGDITSTGAATSYANVVPATKGGAGTVSGLLKANGAGQVSAAVAGTDYAAATGSAAYIQNQTATDQAGGFRVAGAGTVGGTLTAANAVVTTALTGNGGSIGTTVGLGVRADGGLNIGQNTSGSNISLGYAAGSVSTGVKNQFIGYAAGSASTSGNNNVFSGYASGNGNLAGGYNTFEGAFSGNGNTGGNFNTFSGAAAGVYNTTGSNNTAVGANSGPASGSGALTNATALGANVALTTDNTVVLGNGANVGIGTSTPGTRLSISPTAVEPKLTLFDGGSTTAHYGLGVSGGQLNYHVLTTADRHVFYATGKNGDGTELMRIQGNGNVGIGTGTTAPTQKLDVAGNVRVGTASTVGKVLTNTTGTNNMLAAAYGQSGANSSIVYGGSGNFTVATVNNSGIYTITFTTASGLSGVNFDTAVMTASIYGTTPGVATVSGGIGTITVRTFTMGGALTPTPYFTFSAFVQ